MTDVRFGTGITLPLDALPNACVIALAGVVEIGRWWLTAQEAADWTAASARDMLRATLAFAGAL